ncbi:MAG: hypothetical protein PHE17_18195 [Thiothrix sp.]|uniref:hypothetical protein n=1 Tax=Thiothrix sp. TaxID=1032 RepID=UPI002611224B|nr:hypothetical protein [Thiothrix sp.]MDD5394953.1 hypothetical protein [Thiothrix sp.]
MPKLRKGDRRQCSPRIKTMIKAWYESGEFPSVEALYKKARTTFLEYPCLQSIRDWAAKEKWDKNRSQKAIAESLKRSYDDLFAEQGFGDRELVKMVVKNIKKSSTCISGLIMAFKLKGAGAYGTTRMKLVQADEDPRSMPQDERRKLLEGIANAYITQNNK